MLFRSIPSFLRSFVSSSFIPMYILIPLSHFVTCSFIFFLKSSLWIIIHHFSLIILPSIHPSIHLFPVPELPYPLLPHPPILSPKSHSSCRLRVTTPFFSKKKTCKLLYYLRPAIWPLTLFYTSAYSLAWIYTYLCIYIYRYRCIFCLFLFLYI